MCIVMRMWVDKAWSNDKISSVDGFLCTIGDFTNRGNFSVGYDLFDRFDLGVPRNETLYGTELSLKTNIAAAHRAVLRPVTASGLDQVLELYPDVEQAMSAGRSVRPTG